MNSSAAWTNAWADDVLHRYLTTAGAALADPRHTVDISWTPGHIPYGQDTTPLTVTATCLPCLATMHRSWTALAVADLHALRTSNLISPIHDWAQEHAAQCRALLRPEGT